MAEKHREIRMGLWLWLWQQREQGTRRSNCHRNTFKLLHFFINPSSSAPNNPIRNAAPTVSLSPL